MTFSRPAWAGVLPASLFAATLLALASLPLSDAAQQAKEQPKKTPPKVDPEELLKTPPRPKKPALPASTLPLELVKGERVALVGNSTAERFNLYGHFETLLHLRFADKELVVRNFARPADEVSVRQRPNDYTRLGDPMYAFNPDTIICFFGFNESFAGKDGVEKFKADYEKLLDEYAQKYPRDDEKSQPRFVLVTPIAFEPTGDRLLPDGTAHNANLALYADAVKAVGAKRKIAVIDLFGVTLKAFTEKPGMQFTINGCHANEAGDKLIAATLDKGLFGGDNPGLKDTEKYEKLRAAVNDKSWVHQQDYRMVNGWYVYGGRRTWDTET
ncbi:MAG: SGNH/GDSL hydrolase family protein, partial [Gemmataceae bacterium]|nr:SGNH/GDSL hydrolase family protein [Gemmataceae bacterium]